MRGLRTAAQRSAVLGAVDRGLETFRTAIKNSRLGLAVGLRSGTAPEPGAGDEAGDNDDRRLPRFPSVRTAIDRSAVLGRGRRLEAAAANAVSDSFVTGLTHRLATYGRRSFCYRWLTAEPDPDVIVIDLRETWSVGPVLAALDRAITAVVPGVEGAVLARLAERVVDAARARPIALASAGFLGAIAASFLATVLLGEPTRAVGAAHVVAAALAALGLRSRTSLAALRDTRTAAVLAAAFEPPDPPDHQPVGPAETTGDPEKSDASTDESPSNG